MTINHIWFDFSDTIGRVNKARHDELKYDEYAKVTDRSVSNELIKEFDKEYEEHNHSISDIFYSLGQPTGFWSSRIASVDPSDLFVVADNTIPEVLQKISQLKPVSIFSNIDLDNVLWALGIDPNIFKNIISSKMVGKPKPALDGFYKMIELSNLPPNEILYIGDHVKKDILPAKQVGLQTGYIWGASQEADYSFDSFDEILDLITEGS